MRLLVTGGAGFIGSQIVRQAVDAGWDVRVADSLRADAHGPDAHGPDTHGPDAHGPDAHGPAADVSDAAPGLPDGVEFVRADLTDRAAVERVVDDVDVVCHQAAKVGLGVDFGDTADYVASNVYATALVLEAMTARDIRRLVVASSMVVYGEGDYRRPDGTVERPGVRTVADLEAGEFEPVSPTTGERLEPTLTVEDSRLDPRNVYAATKLSQEQLASSWARATGGIAAALRYHNVYGPGMPFDTPYAGVASLFRSFLERGERIRVFEDGGQRRDFVHVADVAAANLAAIDWTARQESGAFRAFNVGSGVVHTIGDLAAVLAAGSDAPEPLTTGEFRLGDVRHITASNERARTELGWRPAVSFEDGMAEFATAPLRGRR